MIIQYVFEFFYLALIAVIILFLGFFYVVTQRAPKERGSQPQESKTGGTADERLDRKEKNWLYFLLAVVLIGNLVTLTPLIPSANYGLWTQATPVKTFTIEVENYQFILPQQPILVPVGQVVRFVLISHDVTYGFGVFRKDGTMVFQMQVLPAPYHNVIAWMFDEPGMYDIRSTEYSGPLNPTMFLQNAIEVEG